MFYRLKKHNTMSSVLKNSTKNFYFIYLFIYFFICSGFCHTLKWNSHGFGWMPAHFHFLGKNSVLPFDVQKRWSPLKICNLICNISPPKTLTVILTILQQEPIVRQPGRNGKGFPDDSVKKPLANAGDTGSIPTLGRSYMLWSSESCAAQFSCLCPRAHTLQRLKPECPRSCALQKEKLPQWEARTPQLESSPHSEQLKKSLSIIEDPA